MDQNSAATAAAVHFFNSVSVVAVVLGVRTQDLIYMCLGAISLIISLIAFILGRLDARKARREDSARTAILERYLADGKETTTTVSILKQAMKKGGI